MTTDMTLRDYFAAKIAATFLRDAVLPTEESQNQAFPMVAKLAYKMADAMIAEKHMQAEREPK